MYKTADLPAKWADVPGAWAALHPAPEYQYVLWTDATLRELIAREYAWLLPTYDAYPHPTQRWDASRYAVLHLYGGLYADLDVHPVRPVDELLRGQTLLLPYTPNIGLTNAIVAATPGHPFLSFALRELPTYARRWYHVTRHFEVLTSTGSTFIWAMHMRWARMHSREVAASLIPAPDWAHGEGSSWHASDSTIVLLAFCHSHTVLALALVVLTWRWTGSRRRAALVGLAMLVSVSVQHALGLVLLETFVGRPIVWLLMS
ncbi:glycosyltransferase family 32 protein [Chrysochromulina tobinii]|uniref:Glycosyltransferase family 32 protein n=1 Tax=Chrysochromulina tobinii TaxID=1460289 RepID=A0A0M0JF02_9EUKA|nr:glycosyltransferase family 32 protein [Chrysochromulina tobinii]|eukprot:KOO25005.1 glycosyltransferase family 32 protein [Chrysochromulina sp. CCMP291]